MNSSAEREPGDVKRHGNSGHNGDDAFDLEAHGLVGGDGDSHGVVVKGVKNPAPACGAYPACGVHLLCPCCAVLRCALCRFANWLQLLRQQLLMLLMIQP